MILKSNRNIVDILLDIMDGGPRPMKKLKVVEVRLLLALAPGFVRSLRIFKASLVLPEKNRNCVDQFWNAHQAEYEARGKLSKDDVERVNQHHLTYPKLGVELDKKKSLSKVRTHDGTQRNDSSRRPYVADCACMKLRRVCQLQKNILKPNCKQRKMNGKTRSSDIQPRVRKTRYRAQKRIKSRLLKTISVNKMSKCHCCYVRVKHKSVGSNMSTILNLEPKNSKKSVDMPQEEISLRSRIAKGRSKARINSRERIDNSLLNEQFNYLKSEEGRSEQSSIKTLKNPDTSIASMSSFNTYASLDQEPMVNMEL